jgi:probable rRNA maturation factor
MPPMTAPAHGISIENEAGYPVDAARLVAAARTVIEQHAIDPASALTVVIANDDEVHRLNIEYREVDSVTDVLSFPADPLPPELAGQIDEPPYLGDLVIAYPYAEAQARSLGHPVMDSLALLVAHGTLHLLGYDHDTPEHRAEMWTAQEQALTALGISAALVPGLEDASHD